MEPSRTLIIMSSLCGLWVLSNGCTVTKQGHQSVAMDWKYQASDAVVSGTVKSRNAQGHHHSGDVVDFEISCIFKGAPLRQHIRIHNVGNAPGQCNNLTVGEKYLVYLKDKGEQWEQEYIPDSWTQTFIDEIRALCDLVVIYPSDVDEKNATETCPSVGDYGDDCMQLPVLTDPTVVVDEGKLPPYVSDDSDDQQPAADQGQGKPVPNESKEAPVVNKNGDNGSTALTSSLSWLSFLMFYILAVN